MGQKILVVEDNELNLKLFCDLLRAHGYDAEPVRDGREAVDRARAFRPDLVVMDIQMPHVSGLELIERFKGDAELRAAPIMAVTAYAAKGDEERIREAGAEGYVSKPISLVRFIDAVRALLDAAPAAPPEATPQAAAEPEPDAGSEVRVERSFAAPAERAFDAWLDPATAGAWLFATPGGESVRAMIEPWPGGRYEIVERRDGEDVVHSGEYEAVERPQRLAFTLRVPLYSPVEARVAIAIAPEGDGCRLVLTQSVDPDGPADPARIEQGWTHILAGLAEQLAEGVSI